MPEIIRRARVAVALAVALGTALTAQAQAPSAEEALHARIVDELRERDPLAAGEYNRAHTLAERYQADEAGPLYASVSRRVPDRGHGYRGQARVAHMQGDDAAALRHMRRALEAERGLLELSAMARLLCRLESPTEAQLAEAARLADEAVATAPDAPWGYEARLLAAMASGRTAEARAAAADVERLADPVTASHMLARAASIGMSSSDRAHDDLARALGERASALGPGELEALIVRTLIAARDGDAASAFDAARRAVELHPDHPLAHCMMAFAHLVGGDIEAARAALEEARRRGLPDAKYRELSSVIDSVGVPIWVLLAIVVALFAGGFFGSFGALLVAGWVLSRVTMRVAARLPREASGNASGVAGWLRASYRVVLWLSCAFYYASLPLLVAGIVLAFAGLVFAVLVMGYIPIKLLLILGLMTIVTVWATLKSVFVRARDEDPGPELDVAKHPRFGATLSEVAERVGTRGVDRVYLTPGTDIAVYERGGMFRQLRGKTERCLILGVAVLEGMSVQELKAILAHEHGHFRNEDTAGGSFALAVRRSLSSMARGLVQGGAASKLNPAWWFVIGFSKVFARISQGASRLQEVLADRWAASAYGSAAFVSGLRHVIARSMRFNERTAAALQEIVAAEEPLANFYRYELKAPLDDAAIEGRIAEELEREPSAYDSHPAPRDRIAWVEALDVRGAAADEAGAWSLFEDRDAIEDEMTEELCQNVAVNFGVVIHRAAPL